MLRTYVSLFDTFAKIEKMAQSVIDNKPSEEEGSENATANPCLLMAEKVISINASFRKDAVSAAA